MKKILFLITVATLPMVSYSQLTGGGGGGGNNNQPAPVAEKGGWKNRFNLNFGIEKPLGTWNDLPAGSATLADAYLQNTGFGAKTGFSFEIGSVFYLKNIQPRPDDKMKLAVNISWFDFSLVPIKKGWQDAGTLYRNASYFPFIFTSFKAGVLGTYNLHDKNYVDVYLNYNPTFSIAGSLYTYTADYNISTSGSGFGQRFSTGVNYRMSVFNIGAEFVLGHINYRSNVYIYDNKTSTSISNDIVTSKFNTNAFRFKIGCSF